MAEAHQGVAFTFSVSEEDGLFLNISHEAIKALIHSGIRNWRKKISRFINSVLSGVYPSRPSRGAMVISVVTGLKIYKNVDLTLGCIDFLKEKIPVNWMSKDQALVTSCVVAGTGLWFGTIALRRYSLRYLFAYQGWMYETQGKFSLKSKLCFVLVRLLSGSKPRLYSYQSFIPHLPLPRLDDTINQYLRTVRPLLDDDKYGRIEQQARDFQKTIGKRLQRYLILKSWVSSNYVSDWWEEYVYLRGRSPIMVNSNFYCSDSGNVPPTKLRAARAGQIVHCIFLYRRELDNETLTPLLIQNMIPLCSRQHDRQFNTTRVPGETTDKLIHKTDTKHIAVYANGKWYKLFVYYQSQLLNPKELEIQFQKILDDKTECCDGEKYLASLTAAERVAWAKTRKSYFSTGINKASLDSIEKSAFVVTFDDEEFVLTSNDDRQVDAYAKSLLHGKGYDRWFDKSFNLIISKNAKVGVNAEHAWADAPVTGHMWETILTDEVKFGYDVSGKTKGEIRYNLPDPVKLRWNIQQECLARIMESLHVATTLLNDVDMHVYKHSEFGKGLAKKHRVSPDAFFQMVLQLAYFREIGKHDLTYESSMTRLFREGRTETVRSCSIESCNWVKSMVDENATNEERYKLFKSACDYHQQQYRNAMTGKGVDRHLFCLYVISKYLEVDSPFLKEILSQPWRLSTSQTPTNQTGKINYDDKLESMIEGGGFGPVADDGYGVSYIIAGENLTYFHISSKKSSNNTDSLRFGTKIRGALFDVKTMLDNVQIAKSGNNKK